jgi:hypothetical protein
MTRIQSFLQKSLFKRFSELLLVVTSKGVQTEFDPLQTTVDDPVLNILL